MTTTITRINPLYLDALFAEATNFKHGVQIGHKEYYTKMQN